MNKVERAIIQILSTEKMVTLPDAGSFIRRDNSDNIVFVALLKRDDKKLTGALQKMYAADATEASTMVEEYASHVNKLLNDSGNCPVDGLGVLVKRNDGNIDLRQTERFVGNRPARDTTPTPHSASTDNSSAARSETVGERATEGTRTKPTVANATVQRAGSAESTTERRTEQRPERGQKSPARKRKSKIDPITIIAIIAALIALCAIAFGTLVQSTPKLQIEPIEEIQSENGDTASQSEAEK